MLCFYHRNQALLLLESSHGCLHQVAVVDVCQNTSLALFCIVSTLYPTISAWIWLVSSLNRWPLVLDPLKSPSLSLVNPSCVGQACVLCYHFHCSLHILTPWLSFTDKPFMLNPRGSRAPVWMVSVTMSFSFVLMVKCRPVTDLLWEHVLKQIRRIRVSPLALWRLLFCSTLPCLRLRFCTFLTWQAVSFLKTFRCY